MDESKEMEKRVKDLAAAGVICKRYGHWWEGDFFLGATGTAIGTIKPSFPATHERKCRICGKKQIGRELEPIKWGDVK